MPSDLITISGPLNLLLTETHTHTRKLVLILTLTCLYVADDSKSSNRMTHTLTEKKAAIVKEKKKVLWPEEAKEKTVFALLSKNGK